MGCNVVKSIDSLNSQQLHNRQPPYGDWNRDRNHNIEHQPNRAAQPTSAAAMEKDIVDTQPQTQSQSTAAWTNMDSQPIENVVWGRLYPKSVKLKSLDLCNEMFAAGRDEGNNLCLTRRELPEKILCRISKVHFQISKDLADVTNPVYIEDLSRNGTFLNGEKIGHKQRQILLNDDVISLSHPQYKAFVYKDLSPNESAGLPKPICARYHIGRKLGAGACGVVRLVYDRRTCEPFAMKHIRKNALLSSTATQQRRQPNAAAAASAKRLDNEGAIMRSLQHPCVVKMHDTIETPDSLFIMLEVMNGGDLLSRIVGKQRLTERIAKLYFVQLCHAVKYLHDKGITHRDLKPDNVLLHTAEEETLLKVSDFGLSKAVANDSVMRTLCGTPLYVAPEVLLTGGRGSYTSKVDVWSLGVVLFTCLSGTLPFSDEYGTAASEQIKKGRFAYRSPAWRSVSADAKQLIEAMLTVRADRRLSIDEVLASAWLQDEEMLRRAEAIMQVRLRPPTTDAEEEAEAEDEVPLQSDDDDRMSGGSGESSAAVAEVVVAEAEMMVDALQLADRRQNERRQASPMEADSLGLCDVGYMLNVEEANGQREDDDELLADQENRSTNFLQPPAAKRRRIEQM